MFVLLIILFTALADYFVGTFIPPSDEKVGKGFVGWKGDFGINQVQKLMTKLFRFCY